MARTNRGHVLTSLPLEDKTNNVGNTKGAKLSSLSATLLLLNSLRVHGASNVLMNEVFRILSCSILQDINSLPPMKYAASKTLKQLGLAYNTIVRALAQILVFYFEVNMQSSEGVRDAKLRDSKE